MVRVKRIKGTPLTPGRAEGISATLDDPKEGSIIVAHSIDPTACLKIVKARGVIVERGGYLSHVAIYTRELGIPCIRIENACQNIPPGRRVRMYEDGTVEVE